MGPQNITVYAHWAAPTVSGVAYITMEGTGGQNLTIPYGGTIDESALPTPQPPEVGLRGWIGMFVTAPFVGVDASLREAILSEAEDALRGTLQRADGTWVIDYVRIRLRAVKA